MIDVAILNRNLGEVCDELVAHLESLGVPLNQVAVVDCSTEENLASRSSTVKVSTPEALEHGLRFNRGMNIALDYLDEKEIKSEWVLFLPVDTEIVSWNIEELLREANSIRNLVAIKPLDPKSPYLPLVGSRPIAIGWNFEEGPWLIRRDFIELQQSISPDGTFFDNRNFRGYLTSLELAFRAYASDYCVGATSMTTMSENEEYLIQRNELMRTESKEENWALMLAEGEVWLASKYGFLDPWTLAWLTRLMYEHYLEIHPEIRHMGL
jgi:hypothetical protein